MNESAPIPLRRGWTTGACATAAVKAALIRLWGAKTLQEVTITLPRGEVPTFALAQQDEGPGWAEAGIIKDAGDDPDVTHGALIVARVSAGGPGVRFFAGEGVGMVTKPGLPIAVGEPAINPIPRQMMEAVLAELAQAYGRKPDIDITLSIPGGVALAVHTWNKRLGIIGGLSVLGTTGIVRPFSCSAWIASIHRGIDVARATGLSHVAACTGATSEAALQAHYDLPDHAMLDMGDFAGGLLKYLRRQPLERLSIGGGIGKLTKLAQGASDLHSRRSQVNFDLLADWLGDPAVAKMNTALEVYENHGISLSQIIAEKARIKAMELLKGAPVIVDVLVVSREGRVIAQARP